MQAVERVAERYARIGKVEDGAEGDMLADMVRDTRVLIDNLDSPLRVPISSQLGQDTGMPPRARPIGIQSVDDNLVKEL